MSTLNPKLESLNQEYRKGIPCIVVANKIDLDMKVTKKSFNFAAKRNIPFYFVSASEVSTRDCCLGFHSILLCHCLRSHC
jgi:ribosome biogenesis GTPase A